ncbi:TIGR04222 domain-containing membrane protein [Streptomyces sp. NPDC059909]|uniref:TIGR04222 domain-containing membrane protein n=1 Tax=Streptomyces sp. NPDC059909 TaxID=3346998 RepID=UPI0036642031
MLFNIIAVLVTIAVAVSSVLLILGLAATRRSAPGGPVRDVREVAFLKGGPARVVDSAVAAMAVDGRLAVGFPGVVSVVRPESGDPVERAVIEASAAAPNGALYTLRRAAMRDPAVQEIGNRLAARGLMIEPRSLRPWRIWASTQWICSFVLLPASMGLTVVQYIGRDGYADLPLPFVVKVLPACLVGLAVGAVCQGRAKGKVTKAGRRAAAEYARAHARSSDAGQLVALRGVRAVPDPILRDRLVAGAGMLWATRPATADGSSTDVLPVVWCAASIAGADGSGGGGCGGADGGSGGSGCGGSSCGGGGGSSCGGGSSSS